jgi:hypothetical protein
MDENECTQIKLIFIGNHLICKKREAWWIPHLNTHMGFLQGRGGTPSLPHCSRSLPTSGSDKAEKQVFFRAVIFAYSPGEVPCEDGHCSGFS